MPKIRRYIPGFALKLRMHLNLELGYSLMENFVRWLNRRESRREYLFNQLVFLGIGGLAALLTGVLGYFMVNRKELLLGNYETTMVLMVLGLVVLLVCTLCSCVSLHRRILDTGSPRWYLILILGLSLHPYTAVVSMVWMLYLLRVPSSEGINRYGEPSTHSRFWQY